MHHFQSIDPGNGALCKETKLWTWQNDAECKIQVALLFWETSIVARVAGDSSTGSQGSSAATSNGQSGSIWFNSVTSIQRENTMNKNTVRKQTTTEHKVNTTRSIDKISQERDLLRQTEDQLRQVWDYCNWILHDNVMSGMCSRHLSAHHKYRYAVSFGSSCNYAQAPL